ncbi:hypothetical protein EVAR_5981_1 [Eumeta japonica]|uniref:Uncharacterized protein n=1 Tax=Eumeta variegata TaxID=151549 RepID=A0A4C1T9F2_EUMVA|nr:hypothetical protein EVAR_5981_1 [Eumeta japonica]
MEPEHEFRAPKVTAPEDVPRLGHGLMQTGLNKMSVLARDPDLEILILARYGRVFFKKTVRMVRRVTDNRRDNNPLLQSPGPAPTQSRPRSRTPE